MRSGGFPRQRRQQHDADDSRGRMQQHQDQHPVPGEAGEHLPRGGPATGWASARRRRKELRPEAREGRDHRRARPPQIAPQAEQQVGEETDDQGDDPTMRNQRIGCGTSQTITAKTITARMAPSRVRMIRGRPSCPISSRDGSSATRSVLMTRFTSRATATVRGATQSNRVKETPSRRSAAVS